MNEDGLIKFVKDFISRRGHPISILDVGAGTGRFGKILRPLMGSNIDRMDAVEKWGGCYTPEHDLYYSKIYTGDIRELFPKLKEYDLIILDGLCHYLEDTDLLPVIHRLTFNGEVLVIKGIHNYYDLNPNIPIAKQMKWGNFSVLPCKPVDDAWVFEKQAGPACSLIIKPSPSYSIHLGGLDSLLSSWLPTSNLIIINDPSVDSRVTASLLALDSGIHNDVLARNLDEAVRSAIELKSKWTGFLTTDYLLNKKWFQMCVGRYDYLAPRNAQVQIRGVTAFHLGANSRLYRYNQMADTPWGKACLRKKFTIWSTIFLTDHLGPGSEAYIDMGSGEFDGEQEGSFILGTSPSYMQYLGATKTPQGRITDEWAPDFMN